MSSGIRTQLTAFENDLNPANISACKYAEVIGYGEISSIFSLSHFHDLAFKRLPLFDHRDAAIQYQTIYDNYCHLLSEAGLNIPQDETQILEPVDGPTVLYICQKKYKSESFAHKLIHTLDDCQIQILFKRIVTEIEKVWEYTQNNTPGTELALDGQLSNWVLEGDLNTGQLYYIDTSTPLYRVHRKEQLDTELFLKSAMPGLRWIIRKFFIKEVINRYYNFRSVMTDLTANLYKEQRPKLIPMALKIINTSRWMSSKSLSESEVYSYYQEDKRIWQIVQLSRRFHRWITTRIMQKRYEFLLPDQIER